MTTRTLVAVCTYRRNDDLRALLDSLQPALSAEPADVLVIDNDADAGGREIVASHPLRARYDVCAAPGIAQARNAALDHRHGYEYIAFVDDDETVDESWLTELMSTAEKYDADVTTGPVVSVFPPDAPSWLVQGGFLQRTRRPTGTKLDFAATNNVLLRTSAIDALAEPRFDESFSRSGGSDAEISWRLVRNGASIVWCDSAVVSEIVPSSRLSIRWTIRRIVRGGNARARLLRREQSRFAIARHGLRLVLLGAARTVLGLLRHRRFQADHVTPLLHGAGVLKFALGSTTYEYSRGT